MKKFVFMVSMIVCILGFSSFVYAGKWEQDITNREWRYRLDDGGLVVNSWLKTEDGSWYHLNKQGYMQKGWILDAGKWYYLDDAKGFMWHNIWYGDYYLGSDGAMFVNTITPDGYKVGSDGRWIVSNHELTKEQKGMLMLIADSVISVKKGKISNYSKKDLFKLFHALLIRDTNHRYNFEYTEIWNPIFSSPIPLHPYRLGYYEYYEHYGYEPHEVLDRFYDITGIRISAEEYFTEQNRREDRMSNEYFISGLGDKGTEYMDQVFFKPKGENLIVHCIYKVEIEFNRYTDIHKIVTFRKNPNSYYGYTVVSMEEN